MRIVHAVIGVGLIQGCLFNADVPPDAKRLCASDADCFDGEACFGDRGCLPAGSDIAPPEIIEATLNKESLNTADIAVITFKTDEPLGEAPIVELAGLPLTHQSGDGVGPWQYEIVMSGTELEGIVEFRATLSDGAQNSIDRFVAVAFADTIAPQLVDARLNVPVGDTWVQSEVLELTVETDEGSEPAEVIFDSGDPRLIA